jgi:signal transduction histidine kinase/ActR/RegA family two-component response regulator
MISHTVFFCDFLEIGERQVKMPVLRDHSHKFDALRSQAEKLIQQQPKSEFDTPVDILELIHELRIHQAELEIQNEELKRAQQEISDLHKEYQNLYEFAPCGYLTLNNKGIITHINLTASRLLNAHREFISRQGFSQYLDQGWEDVYWSARATCAKTGEKQSIEIPIKPKNGPPLWTRADIEADRDDNGAVEQWRIVLVDISEKKRALQALEQSEAKYRKMMESISDPLYVCSPEQTIEYMNSAMIERLGRDATGETCYKTMHGLDAPCEWCPFESVRNGDTFEQNILSPLDNRNYRITHMPVLNEDKTISKLTIYRDITDYLMAVEEKEKAQAQLHQHQKMESIGNLAGGIAHDFNNILASIIGFTELALDDAAPGTKLEENLNEVFIASKRAKDIVAQILAFARQTNEEVRPVQIKRILKECLKLLRSSLPTSIEIKQALNCDASVLGNPTLLQQALMNLATNAMHAMEQDGGILTVQLSNVDFDDEQVKKHHLPKSGTYIKITVSDTGIGIPEHTIQSVFEPYFTTKEPGKGTGMGLALVHGTIKKYGGTILVDSTLGQGTSFSILLPTTNNLDTETTYRSAVLPYGKERILFIDDELTIAKMGKQLLERWGYNVTCRTSSIEALELFRARAHDFDLIITDMNMPNLTGDKLAVELIKIRLDIPIILCTGYSKKMSEETASEIGIKAFVYKPFVKADFAKTVRKILDDVKVTS